jgi:voltage-gated potassium channel
MLTERTESSSYQLFMLALSVFALTALAAGAIMRLDPESQAVLRFADNLVCGLFLMDFLRCLWRAENRWRYLYTWGWLDLASSIPALDIARWGRIARVARILRVLRGARAMKVVGQVVLSRRGESAFLAASLIVILLIVLGSISILQFETIEGSNIRTAEDALWWVVTTITTVGYGDRYPITTEGRFVAALLMCAGVGLFGTFSGFLASWFVSPGNQETEVEVAGLREEIRMMREAVERLAKPAL